MATTEGVLEYPVIGPFGGLSFIHQGEYLKDIQSPDCENVEIVKGELWKRDGFSSFGAGQPLDDSITGFYYVPQIYSVNADYLIATTNKSIYVYNAAGSVDNTATIDAWIYATSGQNIFTVSGSANVPTFALFPTNDTLVVTNGSDGVKKLTPGTYYTLPTAAAFDSDGIVDISQVVVNYLGWALLMNTTESASRYYQRIRHNDGPTNIEDWTGGTSGYSDLSGHPDKIVNAVVLNNKLAVFKEKSITIGNYYSATSPFGYDEDVVSHIGLIGKKAWCLFPGGIFFLGRTPEGGFAGPQIFNLQSVQPVGEEVRKQMLVDQSGIAALDYLAYCIHVPHKNQIWTHLRSPGSSEAQLWIWDYVENWWTKYVLATEMVTYCGISCPDTNLTRASGVRPNGGFGTDHSVFIGTQSTTCKIFRYDDTVYTDNVNTIVSGYWTTKDFFLVNSKGSVIPFNKKRCIKLRLYASATVSTNLSLLYSVDHGTTYTSVATVALTTIPTVHEIPLDFIGNSIRFKFLGAGASKFKIKGFSIHYIDLGVAR